MDLGHGQRRTVVILWGWTAVLSCFVLIPALTSRGNGIVPIGLLALALLLFTLFAPRFGRYSDLGDNSDPADNSDIANNSDIADNSDIAEPPEKAAQGGPPNEAESGSESEPELPKLSS